MSDSCGACPERSRRVGHSCPTLLTSAFDFWDLSPDRQQLAGSPNQVSLNFVAGQKLKSMPQSIAIPHQPPQFQRVRITRQRQFQRSHFPRLQFTSESYPNPILPEFNGAPPKLDRRVRSKDFGRDPNIQRIARKTAQSGWVMKNATHRP